MAKLVRVSRDGSAVIVRVNENSYASVSTDSHDVRTASSLSAAMADGSWRMASADDSETHNSLLEIASANAVKLDITDDRAHRTYRVPSAVRSVVAAALASSDIRDLADPDYVAAAELLDAQSITRPYLDSVRKLSASPRTRGALAKLVGGEAGTSWMNKIYADRVASLTASAFMFDPNMTYLAGGGTDDPTQVDALYAIDNTTNEMSQWVDGAWVPSPDADGSNMTQLDEESATALANWLDNPPAPGEGESSPDGSFFQLSTVNPAEWNMWELASREIDLDFLDHIVAAGVDQTWTSERAPQERSEVAGRQVRDSGGQFLEGEVDDKATDLKSFAKGRLEGGPFDLIPDVASAIGDYLLAANASQDEEAAPDEDPVVSAGEMPQDAPAPSPAAQPAPQTETVDQAAPDTVETRPLYLAIVDSADTSAVLDLVAVIPANPGTNQGPTLWRRNEGAWVSDPEILAQLQSVTPPPAVELDQDSDVQNVVSQIDKHDADAGSEPDGKSTIAASAVVNDYVGSGYDMWGEHGEILPIFAAGVPGTSDTPSDHSNAERLRRYWTHGEGGQKIGWGTGGDWYRCVSHLSKYMGTRAKGYCTLRHRDATGAWPGQAPGEKAMRASAYDGLKLAMFEEDVITQGVLAAGMMVSQMDDYDAPIYADPDAVTVETLEAIPVGKSFIIPVLLPEEIESGDGRKFSRDSVLMRDFPLPLLWQIATGPGHDGAVLVGRIDEVRRLSEGGVGEAIGVFDTGPYGAEAQRLVENKFLRGVSADLDMFEATVEKQETTDIDGEFDITDIEGDPKDSSDEIKNDKITVNQARLMAATLVPKPAFQECYIMIAEGPDAVVAEDSAPLEDGIYEEAPTGDEADDIILSSLAASAAPVKPPKSWFDDPALDKATPLTITDEGRVFGHIASWKTSHIGLPNPTKPPKSASQYAYFQTGTLRTEEGGDVRVGQLTLSGGHAPLRADAAAAVKHYDDTASAVADVSAGEDAHGIWVSGALRPGVTPEDVRVLRASAPSGDWRPINGRLELVAVCQVNVPGFPVARAFVASGHITALVACGARAMAELRDEPVRDLASRVAYLESIEIDKKRSAALSRVADMRNSHRESLVAAANAARARIRPTEVADAPVAEETDENPF